MSDGDLHIPAFSMGQAMAMLADIVAAYVTETQPRAGECTDEEMKVFHQTAISVFLYQLLMRSKHKEQMASILDVIAAELRDQPKASLDREPSEAKPVHEMERALAFYAEPNNWQSPSQGFALQYDPEPSPVQRDRGEVARKCLNGGEPS